MLAGVLTELCVLDGEGVRTSPSVLCVRTFGGGYLERLRLEALDEDDAQRQHEPEVIGVEDRAQGLVLADL